MTRSRVEYHHPIEWLALNGLVPIFGAGVIFWIVCVARLVVEQAAKPKWLEFADPMGWLYVGAGIAVESAVRRYRTLNGWDVWTVVSLIAAAFSGFILFAGMTERGKDDKWQPQRRMKVTAFVVTVGILMVGYRVHKELPKRDIGEVQSTKGGTP